ncbi:Hpt domain-containing protein [Agitococcus lubricus]|uniref:HPt (Histidine-containing phosphotransfer) domain-containing protein n=1 Tax=Agitococcus lubricus TaxID=1077255 RepID=A0A2T5IZ48_9GAMM|nr:Hpt domain-containing protein [Agitococcus lubricus]PTQ89318.1 HPt (histidine-containing phosphotransfer) domain-containing protein [Agitococcus lubricus]
MMTIHVNLEQLAELKEVLEDEFAVLINTYLQDAVLRQDMISSAIARQDYEATRLAAHSLKGASANLGALMLAEICEHLEHDCRAGRYQDCDSLNQKIRAEFLFVKAELSKLI